MGAHGCRHQQGGAHVAVAVGEHRGGYRCHRGDVPVGSLDGLGFGGAPVAPEPGDEEEHVVLRVVARACPSVSIFHPWAVVVHGGFCARPGLC